MESRKPYLATLPGLILGCLVCCALWGSAFPCIKIGYELSFTKYFYEPVKLRPLADIDKDILATKQEMAGLLDEIVGEGGR